MLFPSTDFQTEPPDQLGEILQIVEGHRYNPLAQLSLEAFASVTARRNTQATGRIWSPAEIVQIDGRVTGQS